MKTIIDKRLFWFLKKGTELDLSNKTQLDMYVQQTLSMGKTSDIKKLLKIVKPKNFIDSFNRIKNYLPQEVKKLWEEELGDIIRSSKRNTHSL